MQELIGGHLIKDRKVGKKKLENSKVKARLVIQRDQLYVVCKWGILIHSKVTKQPEFLTYTIPLHPNVNRLFTYYNVFCVIFNM